MTDGGSLGGVLARHLLAGGKADKRGWGDRP